MLEYKSCSIIQRAQTWFFSISLYSFDDQMQLNRVFDFLNYMVVNRTVTVCSSAINWKDQPCNLKTHPSIEGWSLVSLTYFACKLLIRVTWNVCMHMSLITLLTPGDILWLVLFIFTRNHTYSYRIQDISVNLSSSNPSISLILKSHF